MALAEQTRDLRDTGDEKLAVLCESALLLDIQWFVLALKRKPRPSPERGEYLVEPRNSSSSWAAVGARVA